MDCQQQNGGGLQRTTTTTATMAATPPFFLKQETTENRAPSPVVVQQPPPAAQRIKQEPTAESVPAGQLQIPLQIQTQPQPNPPCPPPESRPNLSKAPASIQQTTNLSSSMTQPPASHRGHRPPPQPSPIFTTKMPTQQQGSIVPPSMPSPAFSQPGQCHHLHHHQPHPSPPQYPSPPLSYSNRMPPTNYHHHHPTPPHHPHHHQFAPAQYWSNYNNNHGGGGAAFLPSSSFRPTSAEEIRSTIFATGLHENIPERAVFNLFARFGAIRSYHIVRKPSFAFAFITFFDEHSARNSISHLHGCYIDAFGQTLRVYSYRLPSRQENQFATSFAGAITPKSKAQHPATPKPMPPPATGLLVPSESAPSAALKSTTAATEPTEPKSPTIPPPAEHSTAEAAAAPPIDPPAVQQPTNDEVTRFGFTTCISQEEMAERKKYCVHVKGLSAFAKEDHIQLHFSSMGSVRHVKMLHEEGPGKTFEAIICYNNHKYAAKAVEKLNGEEWLGNKLECKQMDNMETGRIIAENARRQINGHHARPSFDPRARAKSTTLATSRSEKSPIYEDRLQTGGHHESPKPSFDPRARAISTWAGGRSEKSPVAACEDHHESPRTSFKKSPVAPYGDEDRPQSGRHHKDAKISFDPRARAKSTWAGRRSEKSPVASYGNRPQSGRHYESPRPTFDPRARAKSTWAGSGNSTASKFDPRKRRFQISPIRRSRSPIWKKQRREDVTSPSDDQMQRLNIRSRGKTIGAVGKEAFGAKRVTFATTINTNENEYMSEEEVEEEATDRPTKEEAKKVEEGAKRFGCGYGLGQEEQEHRTSKIGNNENPNIHNDNGPKILSDDDDIIILYSTITRSKNGEKAKKIEAMAKECVRGKEKAEQRTSKIVDNGKEDNPTENEPKRMREAADAPEKPASTIRNGGKAEKMVDKWWKSVAREKETREQKMSKKGDKEKPSPMNSSSTESSEEAACSSSSTTMEERVDEMLNIIGNGCEVSSSEMFNLLLDVKKELQWRA